MLMPRQGVGIRVMRLVLLCRTGLVVEGAQAFLRLQAVHDFQLTSLRSCVVRHRVLPRRGWMPVPDRWVQIIRGPRPCAERWPKFVRSASTPTQPFREQAPVGLWRQNEKPRASVPPDVAAAKQRVGGLEAAVAALAAVGTVDGPEVQFLKEL